MIKKCLKACKTYFQNVWFTTLKRAAHDKETRQWVHLVSLKLVYGIVFCAVVERVYAFWADETLTAFMTGESPIRSEQFSLSVLIHYPQYLMVGVFDALIVVLVVNLLVATWLDFARYLYHRKMPLLINESEQANAEVHND